MTKIFLIVALIIPIFILGLAKLFLPYYLILYKVNISYNNILILLVIAPVLEEIVFRGLFFELLFKYLPVHVILNVVLLNLLFAGLHFFKNSNYIYLIGVFICGVIFTCVRIIYHKLSYSILMHIYYNFIYLLFII